MCVDDKSPEVSRSEQREGTGSGVSFGQAKFVKFLEPLPEILSKRECVEFAFPDTNPDR
jgi:hypothetical protein